MFDLLAVFGVVGLLRAVDEGLDHLVEAKKAQAKTAWDEANPNAGVIRGQLPRVHLSRDESDAARRGNMAVRIAGELRAKELRKEFPKAWAEEVGAKW